VATDTYLPPKNQPAAWTAAEAEAAVAYMAAWPLKRLRRHQALTTAQLAAAHALPDSDRRDGALANLRAMEKYLAAAVDRREFPPKR
jgi:hypothetical protein